MRMRTRHRLLTTTLLGALAALYLFPVAVQVATSLKTDPDAAANGLSLVPHPVSTAAWKEVVTPGGAFPVTTWFLNSVLVTLCVTAGRVFFDSLAGYALARLHFRGRRVVSAGLLAVMAVPGVALLIPKFLVVTSLGIYDSYAAMIVPLLADAAGVVIMKQFFESVPVSVEEAARLDGAGAFRTFWSVVLPMARPALVAVTILSVQGSWNEFSHFLVTTGSPEHRTLVTGLAELTAGGYGQGTRYPLKMATALVTTLPVAVLFLWLQRHLARGLRDGVSQV